MTWRSVQVGALVASLAGCGGGSSNAEDAQATTCLELRAAYGAILETFDQSCTIDGQCAALGATDTCNCFAAVSGHCEGFPYRSGSATPSQLQELRELEAAYQLDRCGWELPGICDCAPQPVRCVVGTCRMIEENSCFPDPPDAAPADAAPADASPL